MLKPYWAPHFGFNWKPRRFGVYHSSDEYFFPYISKDVYPAKPFDAKENEMAKFRKKPVVIEAEQFHASKYTELGYLPEGVNFGIPPQMGAATGPDWRVGSFFWVPTLEGWHEASDGDWIITGVKGEKYPCKPDIFEMTYELVVEDSTTKALMSGVSAGLISELENCRANES